MANDLHVAIKWSEPKSVNTKYGHRWVRSWTIPKEWAEGFIAFWKKNEPGLKIKGYSVTKDQINRWVISEWQLRKGDFKEVFGQDNRPAAVRGKILTESTLVKYEVKDTSGLRDWQTESVSRLCASIKKYGAAIDGSDTGTGKTYVACAVARELGMKIAVVCPKAVIHTWKKIITKHFKMDYEFVLNYESVKTGNFKDIGVWKKVSRISTRQYFQWNVPKNTLIVFDESHRLKGHGTQNSEIGIEAKKQNYKILCCSATNAVNPIELKATGYILRLYESNFTKYLRDHGCEKGRFGWEFSGNKDVLLKLHTDLFLQRGIRLRKEDIPGFPDCDIIADSYDIEEESEKELNDIYKEMNKELTILKIKSSSIQEYQMNALVVQLRARQKAELLKVPLIIEMIEEAIEDGMSVAVFVNFTETIKALSKRLKTDCIVWGENKGTERENNIDAFQADKKRIILVNIKAGGSGLSLHDLNGNYPRIAIISPTNSAIDLRQALGRIHRDGAKSKALQKIVFVANTEEEDTCERVKAKLENLDTINDGDMIIGNSYG
jgi:superfamily II DNA or RNA helicase